MLLEQHWRTHNQFQGQELRGKGKRTLVKQAQKVDRCLRQKHWMAKKKGKPGR